MNKISKTKKFVALALAVAMVGTAMSGCSGSKRASDTSNTGSTAAANLSDTFTFAQSADPRGLDPALVDDAASSKIMCNIYEGLLKYKKDSTEVEPCLAESWDISTDKTKYTFHLRKNVKFQDGTDFNADAVKKSIDRQLEPNVTENMPYSSFVFGSIKDKTGVKEVKVVDDNTVEIDLFSPQTPFLKNLAMVLGAPIVSPTALKKYNNNLDDHPVGTGPYSFVSWNKGQSIVLKANDSYWSKDAKAQTKNVVIRFIKENSARVIALTSGEVDALDGIDSTVVSKITAAGDKLYTSEGMNVYYMAYNTTSNTFKNPDTRKAFSQAINVPEMVKSLYKEYGTTATSIIPSFMEGYTTEIKQTAYDADAAKAGLAKAGVKTVNVIASTSAGSNSLITGQVLAETIQGYLKKVDVAYNVKIYDWASYKAELKKGDFDICFSGWNGDNGDPDNFLNLLSVKNPTLNVARYNNADYNALINKGLVMSEGKDRSAIYTQCEQKLAGENIWVPLAHTKNLAAYSPKVNGFYCHQTGITPFSGVTKSK